MNHYFLAKAAKVGYRHRPDCEVYSYLLNQEYIEVAVEILTVGIHFSQTLRNTIRHAL